MLHDYLPYLIELRRRLMRATSLIAILFLFLFWQDETLYTFIAKPLLEFLPIGSALISTEVTAAFTVPMKLALFTAIFLGMPFILFEIWSFVSPGLYKKEKKTILPILWISLLLFYLGSAFSYFIICPMALKFFINSAPKGVTLMTDMRHYLEFFLILFLSGGIAFQVPIITYSCIRARIVSIQQLIHCRPYIIVAAFVLGMLLTPPDVVSQILLALPMWGLFEISLWWGKMEVKS